MLSTLLSVCVYVRASVYVGLINGHVAFHVHAAYVESQLLKTIRKAFTV